MNKKTILVICGGRSTEHSISLLSAKNVLDSVPEKKYKTVIIVINDTGQWFLLSRSEFDTVLKKTKLEKGSKKYTEVTCAPNKGKGMRVLETISGKILAQIDIVFPILHGKYGEDGSIQGLFEMMDVAYIGCGVLSSSLAMDKEIAKRIFRESKIETASSAILHKGDSQKNLFRDYKKTFGLPFFVKPASCGSSVGVHKICTEREFFSAVREAFFYDNKVLIEEMIVGREIECAVMGHYANVNVSTPGEILIENGNKFYSYEAKYLDEGGAEILLPAKLAPSVSKRIRDISLRTYQALGCEGLARVDFFVTMRGRIYVNEVNTLPGFTNMSMYPKLWEQEGITRARLVDKLIRLALQNKKQRDSIRTRYEK